jgi:hypothetical protein
VGSQKKPVFLSEHRTVRTTQTGKKELSIIAAEAWVIALRLSGQIYSYEDLDELGNLQLYQ